MPVIVFVYVVLAGLVINDVNAVNKADLLGGIKNTIPVAEYSVNE